jgi:pSer/pThr/pTyr-binding forkhead associated (FHA) protein
MEKVLLKFKEAVLKEVPIDRDVINIGRKADNDLIIDNMAVSGFHCKLVKEDNSIFVEDLGSLNGTFVNGQKVNKVSLKNGDVILIGNHTLSFIADQTEATGEKKMVTIRGMDETIVLDPLEQKKILVSTDKMELLGGFLIIDGNTEKKDYELKERVTTIGKDESAGIRLRGFFAPKVAALVNRRKEGYFVTTSGDKELKVNGSQVGQRYDLKDGDIVEIAGLKMQFYLIKE